MNLSHPYPASNTHYMEILAPNSKSIYSEVLSSLLKENRNCFHKMFLLPLSNTRKRNLRLFLNISI